MTRNPLVATCLLALCGWHAAAQARLVASAQMDVYVDTERHQYFDYDITTTDSRVGVGLSDGVQYISSSAAGRAEYGVVRARVVSDARNPGSTTYRTPTNRVQVEFRDDVTILAPGVAVGTPALGTISMSVHAGYSADDQGVSDQSLFNSGGSLTFRVAAGTGNDSESFQVGALHGYPSGERRLRVSEYNGSGFDVLYESSQPGSAGYAFARDIELDISFLVGVPFTVDVVMRALANAYAANPGDRATMRVDAMNTATWGGFSNLRLLDGSPLPDFSAFGAALGTDYAAAIQPVPLPGPALLLAGGAALLGMRRRRAWPGAPVQSTARR
ncbi:MAG: hypothetical protein RLW61_18780 [Gammaproteobacteria bacterium]